ncbi:hypothetical protein BD779DRAFT_1234948 [Infundibulicybe gibba]|nr:hypothetical protein BD779DRAFT_1234948 [Infundibulicybe gibba]
MTTRWKFPYRLHFPTSVQREQHHAQVAVSPPQDAATPPQVASLLLGGPPAAEELPPPPSSLTTTNRAPTYSETAHCRDAIDSAEEAILQVRAMVNDLERQKAKLLEFIDAHRVAISPLRSFPPELLEEVFASMLLWRAHWHPSVPHPSCSCGYALGGGNCFDTPRLWTKIFR